MVGGGERDLTLQAMGGIGLLSGVLGDLLGLGLLLLYVRSVLPIGGCLRECNLYTLYYFIFCTENLKMAILKGQNM